MFDPFFAEGDAQILSDLQVDGAAYTFEDHWVSRVDQAFIIILKNGKKNQDGFSEIWSLKNKVVVFFVKVCLESEGQGFSLSAAYGKMP